MDTLFTEKFEEANATDSFTIHNKFLNELLVDESQQGIENHYGFFQSSHNSDLKRVLGKGFLKRKQNATGFLLEKLNTKTSIHEKSDIIHLLGLSGDKSILKNLFEYLSNENDEIRYKVIISLGWLGTSDDIKVLENHYNREKIDYLRGFTVTAMRQIFFRIPSVKAEILNFLFKKIKTEKNEKVIALIIVVIQDLEKMKYGLKEDPNTGDISGDINKAREKIIK